MSTLKTINIIHPSSGTTNVAMDASGNVTLGANATVAGNMLMNSGYGSAATAFGCRAWVNFNGTGTVAIRASGNVTSITDNNTGDYTVNFTTAMPDANYSVVGVAQRNIAYVSGNYGNDVELKNATSSSLATTSVAINTKTGAGTNEDAIVVCVSIFR